MRMWLSLPCDPWCTWHRVNRKKLGFAFKLKNARDKAMSRRMVRLATNIVATLKKEFPALSNAAFEWPNTCHGWSEAGLENLKKMLPYTVVYNGCELGMRSASPPHKMLQQGLPRDQ